MKTPTLLIIAALLAPCFVAAKDDIITIDRCPAPVQKTIQYYAAQHKLEEIGYDKRQKEGGTPRFEVKFESKDGKRFEVHISPDGKVLEIEPKKPKL